MAIAHLRDAVPPEERNTVLPRRKQLVEPFEGTPAAVGQGPDGLAHVGPPFRGADARRENGKRAKPGSRGGGRETG